MPPKTLCTPPSNTCAPVKANLDRLRSEGIKEEGEEDGAMVCDDTTDEAEEAEEEAERMEGVGDSSAFTSLIPSSYQPPHP